MNPRVHRSRVTHDRWLVSYADFITLLFAFFVVLYAFAKADQKKQSQVSVAIDSAFQSLSVLPADIGGVANWSRVRPGNTQSAKAIANSSGEVAKERILSPAQVVSDLEQIRQELQKALADPIAQHTISVEMQRDGLVVSLREAGFFNSGSASPRLETLSTLRKIGDLLSRTPYDVRIEGHTDNVPIHNLEFDSNWELSSVRATHIARLFVEMHAIAPQRLSAAGYAEFHPVVDNDTAEGRAENRRVDLIVMPRSKLDLSAPGTLRSIEGWQKIADE
jgi:chemotaxis protein MotB